MRAGRRRTDGQLDDRPLQTGHLRLFPAPLSSPERASPRREGRLTLIAAGRERQGQKPARGRSRPDSLLWWTTHKGRPGRAPGGCGAAQGLRGGALEMGAGLEHRRGDGAGTQGRPKVEPERLVHKSGWQVVRTTAGSGAAGGPRHLPFRRRAENGGDRKCRRAAAARARCRRGLVHADQPSPPPGLPPDGHVQQRREQLQAKTGACPHASRAAGFPRQGGTGGVGPGFDLAQRRRRRRSPGAPPAPTLAPSFDRATDLNLATYLAGRAMSRRSSCKSGRSHGPSRSSRTTSAGPTSS
jgi:hypothetical protein